MSLTAERRRIIYKGKHFQHSRVALFLIHCLSLRLVVRRTYNPSFTGHALRLVCFGAYPAIQLCIGYAPLPVKGYLILFNKPT